MLTHRTATIITMVTTLLWIFSVVYGLLTPYSSSSVNGVFMAIIGMALAMSCVSGMSADGLVEEETEYKVKHLERPRWMNWLLYKFCRSYWRAEVAMDIAWYDHKDDTAAHVVTGPEECPFCIKEAEKVTASNYTPLLLTNPQPPSGSGTPTNLTSVSSGFNTIHFEEAASRVRVGDKITWDIAKHLPDGSGLYEDSYGNFYVTTLPNPYPQLTRKQLGEFRDYVDSVPFMHYEEGEEITETNWSGEAMVTYTTPDILHCDICPDKRPHYHDEVKVANYEEDAVCLQCNKARIHTHWVEPLQVDVPEYDVVH